MWEDKNILFIHYRVGRTDGVSIEMASWKKAIEAKGGVVKLCSGKINNGADFVVDGLEHEFDEESEWLDRRSFGSELSVADGVVFKERFANHRMKIEGGFEEVFQLFKPDLIIISNMFAVGENLPATVALGNCLDRYRVPTIMIHHDFYWENCRYRAPSNEYIKEVIEKYLPLQRPWIRHSCINSIAQEELWQRKNIWASVIYDNIDFNQAVWVKKDEVEKLLLERGVTKGGVVLLQATRVVRRKNIEVAVEFASRLQKEMKEEDVALVLAGYVEKRDESYMEKLIKLAKCSGVNLVHIADLVGKQFSLEDVYPFADIVTYPSEYEGFGNQFLEAVFAKKPVVLFEYPVYLKDIKPKGFEVVSLGAKVALDKITGLKKIPDKVMGKAVKEVIFLLNNEQRCKEITSLNYLLAREFFGVEAAISGLGS